MLKIFETDINDEYLQCSSCLKSNEDNVNIFRIMVGKYPKQTTCIKLCNECMEQLGIEIEFLEVNGKI